MKIDVATQKLSCVRHTVLMLGVCYFDKTILIVLILHLHWKGLHLSMLSLQTFNHSHTFAIVRRHARADITPLSPQPAIVTATGDVLRQASIFCMGTTRLDTRSSAYTGIGRGKLVIIMGHKSAVMSLSHSVTWS